MKKTTITISYDEEKLSALKLYLEQRNLKIEDELTKSLESLYQKTVPTNVRDFIALRSGSTISAIPKIRKPKPEQETQEDQQ